ncbi:MAG: hypothetical protein ACXWOL_11670 [Ktedonobacteraceae bacterium]
MTLLIVGGLLIIALLAILGAVLMSVSDQRANRAQANGNVTVSSPVSVPLVEQSSAASQAAEKPIPQRQNEHPTSERPLSTIGGGQQPFALNGQFHELTIELQTLYQHAWELERRLRTLSEVADRIEKTHNNQIGIEEQIHAQPSPDNT